MRKWFVFSALACGCVVAFVHAASAQVQIQIQVQPGVQVQAAQIQIQPGQIQAGKAIARPGIMPYIGGNQLTQADAVFVGRVVALEPMDVEAPQVANGPKVNYRIAVVQVTESIFGLKKDAKQVRVGFIAQGNNGPNNGPGGGVQILPIGQPAIQPFPGGGPRRPFPGNFQQQINLQVGQDGLFTVNKHSKENFYLSPNFQNFVTRENNPNFDTSVKTAKQLSKVMGDPVASLKSDDKQDRYAAAAVLISKYRNPNNPTGQPFKQEPIDAAESKLILKALAEGDWKFSAGIPGSLELFNRLGVTPNDGWNNVGFRTQEEFVAAMHKWLDENNGKYRIQKYVVDPNAKDQPVPQRGQPGGIQPIQPLIELNLLPGQQPAPPQPIRRN